jgi:hypothetical protein
MPNKLGKTFSVDYQKQIPQKNFQRVNFKQFFTLSGAREKLNKIIQNYIVRHFVCDKNLKGDILQFLSSLARESLSDKALLIAEEDQKSLQFFTNHVCFSSL